MWYLQGRSTDVHHGTVPEILPSDVPVVVWSGRWREQDPSQGTRRGEYSPGVPSHLRDNRVVVHSRTNTTPDQGRTIVPLRPFSQDPQERDSTRCETQLKSTTDPSTDLSSRVVRLVYPQNPDPFPVPIFTSIPSIPSVPTTTQGSPLTRDTLLYSRVPLYGHTLCPPSSPSLFPPLSGYLDTGSLHSGTSTTSGDRSLLLDSSLTTTG